MTFEAYVAQSQRALLRFAMVLCADPALAEDLVAESLLVGIQRLYLPPEADSPTGILRIPADLRS